MDVVIGIEMAVTLHLYLACRVAARVVFISPPTRIQESMHGTAVNR